MATTKTAIAGFWNNFFSQPPQLEVVAGCSGGWMQLKKFNYYKAFMFMYYIKAYSQWKLKLPPI